METELAGLIDDVDVGILVQDDRGTIIYSNKTALRLLGLRYDEVANMTSLDPSWHVVRPDGSPFPQEQRPGFMAIREGVAQHDVVLGVQRDGGEERRWLLVSSTPHTDEQGAVAHVVSTLSDISSERRRASLLQQIKDDLEEAVRQRTAELAQSVEDLRQTTGELEQSRARFERVTEAVPGVLYQVFRSIAGDVELRFMSGGLRDLCGLEPEQVIADPERLLQTIRAEDLEGIRRALDRAQVRERSFDWEFRVEGPDRKWRWVRSRAVPEVTMQGVLWSGVVLDVTEQRSLAEQMRVSQTRDAIGSVTQGIAHNFNNALAVLVPNLEECLAVAPSSMRASLQESLQAALSSAMLVKQLMVVAQEGSAEAREPVDLAALVREVGALCRRIFRGRVEVVETIAVPVARVTGYPAAIRQMLLNLCINARDALRGIDGGRLEMGVRVVGDNVELTICDDGCGMDEEALRRLGEPFFTTKAPGEGTGLGLATAYATVRDLGGTIDCESTVGVGTVFTISLPLRDLGDAPAVVPSTVQTQAASPAARGRLLIIDDEKLVRNALRKVLTRRGFEVDEAPDGAQGLARIDEAPLPYQGVLLDLSMPGLSGERVLEQLQQTHPALPVVILSGFVEDPSRVAAAAAVLNKPLRTKVLVETLDRVLA